MTDQICTRTAADLILSHAIPAFTVSAPAPDSGLRRSPIYVERTKHDTFCGRGWLIRTCSDGDCEVEMIDARGNMVWSGYVHSCRIRRISVQEWNEIALTRHQ